MCALRLAVVSETFLPDVNGVANSIQALLQALPPERFDVRVFRPKPRQPWQPLQQEYWCRGVAIPMYPDVQLGLPNWNWLKKHWQPWAPDLVYVATEGPLGYSAIREARRRRLPLITAFHTNFHHYSEHYHLGCCRHWVSRWLAYFHRQADITLVPSRDSAENLLAMDIKKVQVLPHGVDCQQYHPSKRCQDLRSQWKAESVWLYVGRIAAEKNIPLLLRAYQHTKATHPETKLVMVGDGPLRDTLMRQYPDVVFTGVLTGEPLARHYASADAFVFPSKSETFGLVTLEALASGLPVVAYDHAAARHFIRSGFNGVLAQGSCDEGFIQACQQLTHYDNRTLAVQARTTAEQSSWQQVAKQFEALVDSLVEPRSTVEENNFRSLV